jgi:hypothetical protein
VFFPASNSSISATCSPGNTVEVFVSLFIMGIV